MKEVDKKTFWNIINNYEGTLEKDYSHLHMPPAIMFWDFTKLGNTFVGKYYEDLNNKLKPTGKMRYFIGDEV